MTRLAVILAGGQSRRMDGRDKALARIGGERLIDRVIARLAPQADSIVISGRSNYETGLKLVPDLAEGPKGPAAGLFAMLRWIEKNENAAAGFLTVPVDAPFLPADLFERLEAGGRSAIAADEEGVHPTFAYWTPSALRAGFAALAEEESISLRALASAAEAAKVRWDGRRSFFNVNAPVDLDTARRHDSE